MISPTGMLSDIPVKPIALPILYSFPPPFSHSIFSKGIQMRQVKTRQVCVRTRSCFRHPIVTRYMTCFFKIDRGLGLSYDNRISPDFTQQVDHEASYKPDDLQEESCQRNPVRRRLCEGGDQKLPSQPPKKRVECKQCGVTHTHTHRNDFILDL